MGRATGAAVVVVLAILQFLCSDSGNRALGWRFEGIPDEALPTSSGYLTVNESRGSSMFYVYYEAISPVGSIPETPLILWLQGGPGCSGLEGNFGELGPWIIGPDQQFHSNPGSWNRLFGLLFVDNPIGTGFSIAPTQEDVPKSDEEMARDLYNALTAFFVENPSFQSRPLFVTGESYAGKYVPAFGYYWLQQHKSGEVPPPPFRLAGLAVGNSLTDPISQVPVYGSAAYYMGLIDQDQLELDDQLADRVVAHIREGRYDLAHRARSMLMRSLYNQTGLATLLDIRREVDYFSYPNGSSWLVSVVNRESVKSALGADLNKTWEGCTDFVSPAYLNQTMMSTKFMFEAVIPELPVLLYQGQFDLQDGVASNEAWMRKLNWTETSAFWSTERKVWSIDGVLAGYIRTHETLSHVVIMGAGHLVPTDQSLPAQKMIEAWIHGTLGSLGNSASNIATFNHPMISAHHGMLNRLY